MSTALEVITGALVEIGVRAAESPITDAEAADGLRDLNLMLNKWERVKRIPIGFETLDDLQDILPVDEGVIDGITSNLAVKIAPQYMKPVSQDLRDRARNDLREIQAWALTFNVQYPDSLPVGSGNEDPSSGSSADTNASGVDRFYPTNT